MRIAFLLAAIFLVFLAVAHSYLGERYILMRLFRLEGLPKLFGGPAFTRQTLRFAWHLTSVAWVGFGGVLVTLAFPASAWSLAQVIAITFGVSGALALVGSRGRHLSWVVFFTIAALVWGGLR